MTPQEREFFFKTLTLTIPNVETELKYTNPYTLLVAVVLSAQSTDKGVNKATEALFQKVYTPQDMIIFGEENLKNAIKTIGLYKTKAKNIIHLSRILIEEFKGQVPATREQLIKLPGVGRKTANVVLNVVFNQPTIPVDTHVFRVSNRTGLASGKTPLEVEEKLEKNIPKAYLHTAHHLLVFHGRYTCKAIKPLCEICPVSSVCAYFQKMR